jgi:hypothetical protein
MHIIVTFFRFWYFCFYSGGLPSHVPCGTNDLDPTLRLSFQLRPF